MDKVILVLAVTVAVSGCMHTSQINTTTSSGSGLEITTFDVSDKTLSPGRQGLITVELNNYHSQDIQIDDVSLYNTGILETERRGCSPSDSEIRGAREDYIPTVECTWTVTAPEENVDGFNSKTIPVKLNLAYQSQISNSDRPVKVHFRSLDEIEQTNEVAETFTNGEVEMEIQTESPVQFEGTPMTVKVRNDGNGRVDSDYSFEYFPAEVISGCPSSKEPLAEQEAEFTCEIDPQTQTSQTRNVIVSASYKYVKAPTLDVEVVNR